MNYRMLIYLLGIITMIEAALMVFPLLVALIYGESVMPFLITMAIMLVLALPIVIFKPKNKRIYAKEGFITAATSWLLLSCFGALPFVFSGAIPNYIDALFETVSGFTTTGASILTEVESLPRGILFWRSFTHWVGGMGVLVFMLAILPTDNGHAMHLLRAEVPGPTKDKIVPKMRQTALILYGIYMALTVVLFIALLCTKMPPYDSIVNAFATAGTGGFSVKNASIGAYQNPAAEWVIALFMLLFGANFNIYFLLLIKRFRDVLKNEELRVYLVLCVLATALITLNTLSYFPTVGETVRTAFFQVSTLISTTGFVTTNYDLWPSFSKTILLLVMVTGSCAGSTAGGLKISRVIIAIKNMFRSVKKTIRPRSVNVVRMDGEAVPDATLHATASYVSIYFALIVIVTLLLSFDGFSIETNLTATLATINNVGPGLATVGPTGNYAAFSPFSKIVLAFSMLIGRLEIMPILILFSPTTWRRG
ncbi:MAG: TrkH family potassium uptake protein [Ruminococcaceae bacterium]|nr:TrkH family potassium uptake protein [Oscillospiraceae bacterium]